MEPWTTRSADGKRLSTSYGTGSIPSAAMKASPPCGRLDEAIAVLRAAPIHESTGSAPRVMLALALHSAGHKDEALRVAIEAQIEALPQYQRSMRNYAAALTASTGPDDLATR